MPQSRVHRCQSHLVALVKSGYKELAKHPGHNLRQYGTVCILCSYINLLVNYVNYIILCLAIWLLSKPKV